MTCGSVAGEKPGEDCAGFANSEAPYYFERIGKDRWYLASNRRTKEGGTVSVRTDVSGSKASEQELRKLGRALEQSPASVVITDTGGVIEYVNPKFEQVSGYSAAEVLGRKPSVLKSGETTDAASHGERSEGW
ncbi:PAS domain S-box protein [Thiolapillus sp.]